MIAGRMKYMLEIYQPVNTTDKFGAKTTTWTLTNTVHAERVKLTGRRVTQTAEIFPEYTAEFNIRDVHTIAENWRVQQQGGNLYTVVAIVPNIDRGYLTLICDRVNE